MTYNLFLDDDREPSTVGNYANPVDIRPLYRKEEWVIVRNYPEFIATLEDKGIPAMTSLDHDLYPDTWEKNLVDDVMDYGAADFNQPLKRTGYHCLMYLLGLSAWNLELTPRILIHTANSIAAENMYTLIKLWKGFSTWEEKVFYINHEACKIGMRKEVARLLQKYFI